jgi:apolipoprotein N-acyltransferase
VALAPLLAIGWGAGARRGALFGFLYGVAFFGVLIVWVKYVGWLAWGALTILEASFLALFGAAWGAIGRRFNGIGAVLLGAAAWVAVEYLRQQLPVLGFTWGQLAQSQHNVGWMLDLAGVAGGWGIAFVLIVLNGAVAVAVRGRRRDGALLAGAAAVIVLTGVLLQSGAPPEPHARVAIVQGNVPRSFTGTLAEKNIEIINSHAALTRRLPDDVDLVVWPESAVGLDMNRVEVVREAVVSAAGSVEKEMIVGGNEDFGPGYKVLAYHLSPAGDVLDTYQKTHLVPFGEYVPWRGLTGWIPQLEQVSRDAVPGDTPKVFETSIGPVAPVISFEGDFGSLVRHRIGDTGGRLLIVATNTSTWATSWASAQHLAFSQVRAAENGVHVVHAALSGISAFVRPDGSVTRSTDMWTADTLIEDVAVVDEVSFYARTGDWLPLGSLAATLVALVLAWVRRPRPGSV